MLKCKLTLTELKKAVSCCKKMTNGSEKDCCAKCPLKRYRENCYARLLELLEREVFERLWSFVQFLNNNPDFEIKDETGENIISSCIDLDKLGDKTYEYLIFCGLEEGYELH